MEVKITKKQGFIKLIQARNYRTLLTANFISRFGDSVDSIAYAWMVYILTGSKLLMGTLFALNFIPNIVFSLFSGVFADYFPKKRTVLLCDLGRGTVVSLTALLFLTSHLQVWHLFIFTIVNSTFETFGQPARGTILPLIIKKEDFQSAISLSSSAASFAELLGTGVAAALIGLIGIAGAIFVDAATFFISFILILTIKLENDNVNKKPINIDIFKENMKEGLKYLKENKIIKTCIILFATINIMFTPLNVLMPVFSRDFLRSGELGLSILGIGISSGMIIGGLSVSVIGHKFKKINLMSIGIFVIGVCYAALGFIIILNLSYSLTLALAGFMFFLVGLFIPIATTPIQAFIMEKIPTEVMGRVFAVMGMLMMCSIPLGAFLTGVITEYVKIINLFIVMGVCTSLLAIGIRVKNIFKTIE